MTIETRPYEDSPEQEAAKAAAQTVVQGPNKDTWYNTPALAAFRNRILGLTPQQLNTGWEDILVPQGAGELLAHFEDHELYHWLEAWWDYHLAAGLREEALYYGSELRFPGAPPGFPMWHYCGSWSLAFSLQPFLASNPKPKYRDAVIKVAQYALDNAPYAEDGVITHSGPVQQVWVDTMYFSIPVFTAGYLETGDQRFADMAIRQCLLHAKYLRDEQNGLWHHHADPKTNIRTSSFWSRGNGWVICALADALAFCPPETEGYEQTLQLYRTHCEAVLRYQHVTGLWRVVPENDALHLETSGTVLLLHGLTMGVLHGWIEPFTLTAVRRGFIELQTWIKKDGMLMGSQSPNGPGNWDNLKRSSFGEDTYTTGVMLRLIASLAKAETKLSDQAYLI